MIIFILYSYY